MTHQMFFKSSRAPTISSVTLSLWSKTFETTLEIKHCVSDLVIAQPLTLLTTKVSLVWTHVSLRTCDESTWHKTITLGPVDRGEPSIRSARFGKISQTLYAWTPREWEGVPIHSIYWWLYQEIPLSQGNRPSFLQLWCKTWHCLWMCVVMHSWRWLTIL